MNPDQKLRAAAEAIEAADALLITAGAGMGVDSGLPDFRGKEGFWRAYPVIADLGLRFEEMANPKWFQSDPYLAWAFYGHRLNLYRRTVPHRGFYQLLSIAVGKPAGYFVFTSNVDGHFQKAGFAAEKIMECHGSIHHLQCIKDCGGRIWSADGVSVKVNEIAFRALDPLPSCPECSGLARPNILMFGDWQWLDSRACDQRERFDYWLEDLSRIRAKSVVIEIGAGTAIPSVRHTSEEAARITRGTLIRINPFESAVPEDHIGLQLGAGEALDKICRLISGAPN